MKTKTDTVLVIAAHPDDEVLGCGGTIARHVQNGDRVHIFIAAEGATSRDTTRDVEGRAGELDALRQAAAAAAEILGAEEPRFGGLPDNRLDGLDLLDIIKPVEALIEEIAPDVVYTHHGEDLNVDHRCLHQAVLTACRPMPGSKARCLWAFETISSTEWATPGAHTAFLPNRFVDITETLDKKLDALRAYDVEMRPFPHARSLEAVEAQARLRGSTAAVPVAEAFHLLREVIA